VVVGCAEIAAPRRSEPLVTSTVPPADSAPVAPPLQTMVVDGSSPHAASPVMINAETRNNRIPIMWAAAYT
jgi:hypothetical protein